jgi:hypothetical protein
MIDRKSNQRPCPAASAFGLENLEGRRLLSASVHHHAHASARHASHGSVVLSSAPTLSPVSGPASGPISTIGSLLGNVIQYQNAPPAVQATLQANAPAGVTISPTQNVFVLKTKTTTDYTLSLNIAGTRTTITVNAAGTLVNLVTSTTIQFSDVPPAVQTGMQALAPSGVTISPTQNVFVNTVNGVTTYMAIVPTGKKFGPIPLAKLIIVDANGNPINRGISAI